MTRYLPKGNRELTIVAVSFAAGGMLIGFGCGMHLLAYTYGAEKTGQMLGGIGDFLTGIGTLGLMAAAFLGVQRWEERRKKEKRADVAEEALMLSVDLFWLMARSRPEYPWATQGTEIPKRQALLMRLSAPGFLKRIERTRTRVEAILGKGKKKESGAIFGALLGRRERMQKRLEEEVKPNPPSTHPSLGEERNDLFGPMARREMEKELDALKAHLGPIALLD